MSIVNLRYGFATNSSSSHSVIMRAGPRTESKEELAEKYSSYGQYRFGWEEETYYDWDSIVNYGVILFLRSWRPIAEAVDASYNQINPKHREGSWWSKKFLMNEYELAERLNKLVSYGTISEATATILKKFDWDADAYIDHQSLEDWNGVGEDDFWNFVLAVETIETDNDNH